MNALDNNSPVPTEQPVEQSIVVHENVPLTLATTDDIKELKSIILEQNVLIEKQNSKIDQLMSMVLELHKRGKKRGNNSVEDFSQKNENDSNLAFSYPELKLPLKTLDAITKLEEMLKDDVSANHFRSFLLQLGGHNLKTVINHIIHRVYSLQLQGKVNYTGREGKCSMSRLQTKIILEVMRRNTRKTEAEAIGEYHMQHVSDQIRSAERMATRMNNM
ncbi:hypothetical protein NQ314_015546 [Rhamnusium bicolor]|uniref:DUF4806 domain-containing protein n=1 Tax=Rhamnusium bicolor TaxID=1586634 RepID=A0AAV8WYK1_9CUCU|nr:hypothetical protein NQ314_015546 [Rhamnusium bicolor]